MSSLTRTSPSSSARDSQADALFGRFWERMAAMFQTSWTGKMGDTPFHPDGTLTVQGETWRMGLKGITARQIGVGMEKLVTSGTVYVPKLPEFRMLCLDMPSIDEVIPYFHGRGEITPFILAMVRKMDKHGGTFAFRNANVERAERMLRNAYEAVRSDTSMGIPLPEIPKALTAEKREPTPANPETVAAARAAIIAKLNLNPDLSPVDQPEETKDLP